MALCSAPACGCHCCSRARIGTESGAQCKPKCPDCHTGDQLRPHRAGYVSSLAHPGGNITGLFYRQFELAAKKVELLAQTFPGRTRLAILWDALVTDESFCHQPDFFGREQM